MNFQGEDKLVFTIDVASLYTVIPNVNGEGLPALKHFLFFFFLTVNSFHLKMTQSALGPL